MVSRFSRLAALLVVCSFLLLSLPVVSAIEGADAFLTTWMRADQPVNEHVVNRTWVWGPLSTAYQTSESYVEAPDGERVVMYFDKARMEVTHPEADPSNLWYVTNGLLVVELMSGWLQVGDNAFEQRAPSGANVAGDPVQTYGISYALFAEARDEAPFPAGHTLTTWVERFGGSPMNPAYLGFTEVPAMAQYGVTATHDVPETNHRIASVFWEFMTSSGLVWEDDGYVTDALFQNPFYATGYPITEAYWAGVIVGGVQRDVLMQCFERRCLTYTPSNPAGWQVEMGNVGQHYYNWRYGHPIPGGATATAYMIAMGDNGQSGIPVGCDDSLIPVTIPIWPTSSLEEQIAATLTVLLSFDDPFYGESGLYNALHQSDAQVEQVTVANGVATVELVGSIVSAGTCDDPRILGQLRQTVLAAGVDEVVFSLNGAPFPPQQP